MINRESFFERTRAFFGGSLSQSQVDGLTTILDHWESSTYGDTRWLAYMLATTKWETANTMQAIAEYGHGAGQPYGKPDPDTGQCYYGRGLVQLTWRTNYEKFGARLGIDLVNQPDLALDIRNAVNIMFDGMVNGLFTGVGLPRYFHDTAEDWINARRIINGTDHANEISAIGHAFMAALTN